MLFTNAPLAQSKQWRTIQNMLRDPKEIFDIMEEEGVSSLSPTDRELITRACVIAEKAHEGQARKSGEPYYHHVFEVGKNLAHFGMDATTISAGILHDVIEDTSVTEQDLEKEFGKEIVFLVKGVTKLGTVKYRGEERHVESLRKFFIASSKDVRVVIIKFADRLHNLSTLAAVPPEKQKRIALESIEIYAPLAYRLGMGRLTKEIEDLAFPFAYPKEYKMVEEMLKQRKNTDEKYVEKVYKSLKKELAAQGIKDIRTDYRLKHKYSLYRKLQRKDMDGDTVYDIVALRVIVPTIEDCYRVLGLVHTMWRPLPGRIKDYIALPKTNGYRSLHTTIFTGDGGIAEIQIRTPEMHSQAEFGIASHFMYKQLQQGKPVSNEHSGWLKNLSDLQKDEKKPSQFLNNLLTDFFSDRIFIFTPKGDVIDLPKGSSVLDFAYAVHSELGNHAQGAKINNKYSALKTELHNNDIVEIEKNPSTAPTSKWLDFVKTTLARKHINKYLKDHPSGGLLKRIFN